MDLLWLGFHCASLTSLFSNLPLRTFEMLSYFFFYLFEAPSPPVSLLSSNQFQGTWGSSKIDQSKFRFHVAMCSAKECLDKNALDLTAELEAKWWRISSIGLTLFQNLDFCSPAASKLFIQALKAVFKPRPITDVSDSSRTRELFYAKTTLFVGGDWETPKKTASENLELSYTSLDCTLCLLTCVWDCERCSGNNPLVVM